MTKKETFKWVVQIIASIATAMGTTSCMGVLDEKSVLESDFPERFVFSLYVVMGCYFFLGPNLPRPPIKPPFTCSISSIVRARALISITFFVIFLVNTISFHIFAPSMLNLNT